MIKRIVFRLLFICVAAILSAGGAKEKKTVIEMEQVSQSFEHAEANEPTSTVAEITGIVRLVGSSPITELVITAAGAEWHIEKEEEYKLKDLQQKTITVIGDETIISLTFANGLPAGQRRILKNIKIITAQ